MAKDFYLTSKHFPPNGDDFKTGGKDDYYR